MSDQFEVWLCQKCGDTKKLPPSNAPTPECNNHHSGNWRVYSPMIKVFPVEAKRLTEKDMDPCPFCGHNSPQVVPIEGAKWWPMCAAGKCICSSLPRTYQLAFNSVHEAVVAWNSRSE